MGEVQKSRWRRGTASGAKKVDIIKVPFDPGGQPDTRTGQPVELRFFPLNIKGGKTASKAVLADPARYQNFWEWPNSMCLVQLAEEIGFDYRVPFGRWIAQEGATDYKGAALDFLASAAATALSQNALVSSPQHISPVQQSRRVAQAERVHTQTIISSAS